MFRCSKTSVGAAGNRNPYVLLFLYVKVHHKAGIGGVGINTRL